MYTPPECLRMHGEYLVTAPEYPGRSALRVGIPHHDRLRRMIETGEAKFDSTVERGGQKWHRYVPTSAFHADRP